MSKPVKLENYKAQLQIIREGKDDKGNTYNNFGVLNAAAWIGENSGCLIKEIEELRKEKIVLLNALIYAKRFIDGDRADIGYLEETIAQMKEEK